MSVPALLSVEDVAVAMRRGARHVERLRFEVARGEAVALIGPHGSGKSALLLAVAGMAAPSEGRVLFEGKDVAALGYDAMRRHRTKLGLVFEGGGFLSNRSVLDNIVLPLAYHGRASLAQATVHLKARALCAELGLEDGLDLVGLQASPRLQRLALYARALIGEPELLLVDGPRTSLSAKLGARVAAAIEKRRRERKMTVVYADTDASLGAFAVSRTVYMFQEHLSDHPPPSMQLEGDGDAPPSSRVGGPPPGGGAP